ncbi:MEMO1 family [Protomyces lactucae-debilis]|uniref:MEMO1 family n=1 Tax=Protomyces lactucae-debilis TaxID=2754530 RepID=A0A1Y2FXE7_PROLT|nr:MEMO1 family [Protomyces lactucae-debilis]ORY87856.1 MEMO1 family [Protomyces lactucae-debilis]
MTARKAAHAGSWYSDNAAELGSKLDSYIAQTDTEQHSLPGARIIISPHAGYSYSGPTAAFGFKALDLTGIQRIFILGPSHHMIMRECALPQATIYETPLGPLQIDTDAIARLRATGRFENLANCYDEREHSIEMQLPFLKHIMGDKDIPIVPILVGGLSFDVECEYGDILKNDVANPANAFVISSDFCHWGQRFRYKYFHAPPNEPVKSVRSEKNLPIKIWESIELMDREGIRCIESQSHEAFADYLDETGNTICGRHPISVMLAAMERAGLPGAWQLLDYRQSNQVISGTDGSVSYVSEVFVLET